MPIKKSQLEQKWYYRVAKAFFLILPIVIVIIFLLGLLGGKINICDPSPNNILDILQKYIVYIVVGLLLYYLILNAIWRLFLYIVFGGLEDDKEKKDDDKQAAAKSEPSKKEQLMPLFVILILIAIFFALYFAGYIDLSNFFKVTPSPGPTTCHATSAQWGHPCHSVSGGVGVSGLPIPDACSCPTDTKFASMDNITPGGPYKICVCR